MKIFEEVPEIHVGIVRSMSLELGFQHTYLCSEGGRLMDGRAEAVLSSGRIAIRQEGQVVAEGPDLVFSPADASNTGFGINKVVIGIGFHWEQKEDQYFEGVLKLLLVDGEIQAVNQVSVEKYLGSVISSEMSGNSSLALLKAHTIISRSWLLAQIEKRDEIFRSGTLQNASIKSEEACIRWYDREDHQYFDVCADDHCQRYQGITRSGNPVVLKAVEQTKGEVLVANGKICDARFSKCCGGVTEEFQYCWEPKAHSYLKRVDDNPEAAGINRADLKVESNAEHFIKGRPLAFCSTRNGALLKQVLNDYDQSFSDFYRWEVSYSQDEIAALIREKSGMDFGSILDLIPMERGESGRLIKLKIVGTARTMIVGKELEIRRWLSNSHLYSSAFIVEKSELKEGVPGSFFLRGAGWGHGVGLCQIGAAHMASRDYSHEKILKHYFRGAGIKKLYE